MAAGVLAGGVLTVGCGDSPDTVVPADVVTSWTDDFTVRAAKTEPTFVERLTYSRHGDQFALDAVSSDGDLGRIVVEVAPDGAVTPLSCRPGTDCDGPWSTGFLATAAVVSAARTGRLVGEGDVERFADRPVVCIPAEVLGARQPPLDPCLDTATGAVLAHRHRSDGSFDGPTPDPGSVFVDTTADIALFDIDHPRKGGLP